MKAWKIAENIFSKIEPVKVTTEFIIKHFPMKETTVRTLRSPTGPLTIHSFLPYGVLSLVLVLCKEFKTQPHLISIPTHLSILFAGSVGLRYSLKVPPINTKLTYVNVAIIGLSLIHLIRHRKDSNLKYMNKPMPKLHK